MSQTIEITIDENGRIQTEAKGFKDGSCLDVLKDIEKMFGKASELKLKPEGRISAKKHRVKA